MFVASLSTRKRQTGIVVFAMLCFLMWNSFEQVYSQSMIGLNFTTSDSAIADPPNWNRVSILEGSINNLIDDSGNATNIGVTIGGSPSGFLYLSTNILASDAVPQHSYDLSGMTGYGFRAGSDLFVEFTGLQANFLHEFWFVAYRGGGAIDNLVQVSSFDNLDAQSFSQTISFDDNDGRFLINSVISSDSQQWSNLGLLTYSSSSGTIRFNFSGQTQTTVIGGLAIRAIPEPGTGAFWIIGSLIVGNYRRRSK